MDLTNNDNSSQVNYCSCI